MDQGMHQGTMNQDKPIMVPKKAMATAMPKKMGKDKMSEKDGMSPEDMKRGYRVVR